MRINLKNAYSNVSQYGSLPVWAHLQPEAVNLVSVRIRNSPGVLPPRLAALQPYLCWYIALLFKNFVLIITITDSIFTAVR